MSRRPKDFFLNPAAASDGYTTADTEAEEDDFMYDYHYVKKPSFSIRKKWFILLMPVWYLGTLVLTIYLVPTRSSRPILLLPTSPPATQPCKGSRQNGFIAAIADSNPALVYFSNKRKSTVATTVPSLPRSRMVQLPSMLPGTAFYQRNPQQEGLVRDLSRAVLSNVHKVHARSAHVKWGGTVPFWMPSLHHQKNQQHIDGGTLLSYYAQITQRTSDSDAIFPTKLCRNGCPLHRPFEHTLQWRESYQPWKHTKAMMKENRDGWVYTRGHSAQSQHSMLWVRIGRHTVMDEPSYYRCIVHATDRAVAKALKHSDHKVGKYNVLIDASDFTWSKVPDMKYTRQALLMLSDHYPSRLGVVLLTNLSRLAELAVNIVKPLLSKDVRGKLLILSHDPDTRLRQLAQFVEPEYIPVWLGGSDHYSFDAHHVYPRRHRFPHEQDAMAFETDMPYHALAA